MGNFLRGIFSPKSHAERLRDIENRNQRVNNLDPTDDEDEENEENDTSLHKKKTKTQKLKENFTKTNHKLKKSAKNVAEWLKIHYVEVIKWIYVGQFIVNICIGFLFPIGYLILNPLFKKSNPWTLLIFLGLELIRMILQLIDPYRRVSKLRYIWFKEPNEYRLTKILKGQRNYFVWGLITQAWIWVHIHSNLISQTGCLNPVVLGFDCLLLSIVSLHWILWSIHFFQLVILLPGNFAFFIIFSFIPVNKNEDEFKEQEKKELLMESELLREGQLEVVIKKLKKQIKKLKGKQPNGDNDDDDDDKEEEIPESITPSSVPNLNSLETIQQNPFQNQNQNRKDSGQYLDHLDIDFKKNAKRKYRNNDDDDTTNITNTPAMGSNSIYPLIDEN